MLLRWRDLTDLNTFVKKYAGTEEARHALYRIKQLDDAEFEKARTMNTIGSYEQYITLFPEGAGVDLARQHIAAFRVKAQKEDDLRKQLDQAREERKLLEEELRRKREEVTTIVPPPPPVGGAKWGWYAIAYCSTDWQQARDVQRSIGGAIIDTNDRVSYPNFRQGWYCVGQGPLDKSTSLSATERMKSQGYGTAYIKNAC
jgi:hypothetical protein